MKKLISKSKYVVLALIVALTFSCSAEDGADGEQGPQGEQGVAGTDGNANVIAKTVDNITWSPGTYLGGAANVFEISDTDINENVMESSLILVYFQLFGEDIWYPMTFDYPLTSGEDQVITFTYELNTLTFYAKQSSGELNAAITKIRYFIIDSSNNTSRSHNILYNDALELYNIKL